MKKKAFLNIQRNKILIYKTIILIILVCIVLLLLKVVTMVKQNYEAFNENPLLYGAEKYNIEHCACYTSDNKNFFFNKNKIWMEMKSDSPDLTDVNISFTLQNAK